MDTSDILDFSETINSILKINKRSVSNGNAAETGYKNEINGYMETSNHKHVELVDLASSDDEEDQHQHQPQPQKQLQLQQQQRSVVQMQQSLSSSSGISLRPVQPTRTSVITPTPIQKSSSSYSNAVSMNPSFRLEPEVILRVEGDHLTCNNSQIKDPKMNGSLKMVPKNSSTTRNCADDDANVSKKIKLMIKKTGVPVKIHSNEVKTVNNLKNQENCTIRKTGRKKDLVKNQAKTFNYINGGVEVRDLSSIENSDSESDWKKQSESGSDSESRIRKTTNDRDDSKNLKVHEYPSLKVKMKTSWMEFLEKQSHNNDKQKLYQRISDFSNVRSHDLFQWVLSKNLFFLNRGDLLPKYLILQNSIFDVSKQPKVVVELMTHWVLQTEAKIVVHKLDVDMQFLKGFYQCLRAICTLSLSYKRFATNKDIVELGLTSLQIHVKNNKKFVLNILGAYNSTKKIFRHFLIINNSKIGMKKIITAWIERTCVLFIDDKINKQVLQSMGYNVFSERSNITKNFHIKTSLERRLLNLFQGQIHRMDNSLVQQFLDELAWRDEFGKSYDELLKSIIDCTQFQTRQWSNFNFLEFLNNVAKNPQDFLIQQNFNKRCYSKIQQEETKNSVIGIKSSTSSGHKRVDCEQNKLQTAKQLLLKKKAYPPLQTRSATLNSIESAKCMEKIYFGYKFGRRNDNFTKSNTQFSCEKCKKSFQNNIEFLDHLNGLHFNCHDEHESNLCRYCMQKFESVKHLKQHIDTKHPLTIVNSEEDSFSCPICETTYSTMPEIRAHLNDIHPPYELPYQCHVCSFLCYSHRLAVDHFYFEHKGFNLIQCPLCLNCVSFKKTKDPYHKDEVEVYLSHLKKHMAPKSVKCKKCVLTFITTDECAKHFVKSHLPTQKDVVQFNNFQNCVIQNLLCFECNDSLFLNAGHLRIMSSCEKCDYTTYCRKAFSIHMCTENKYTFQLEKDMLCLCGYKSSDGFELARHLVFCKHKTVYGSVTEAEFTHSNGSYLISLGLERKYH